MQTWMGKALFKCLKVDQGCSLVAKQLPSMQEALDLIPSTEKKKIIFFHTKNASLRKETFLSEPL